MATMTSIQRDIRLLLSEGWCGDMLRQFIERLVECWRGYQRSMWWLVIAARVDGGGESRYAMPAAGARERSLRG
jgi:hypothetical protein